MNDPILQLLTEKFGIASFRPSQREAINTLLTESRLLVILPTGYGKSLLYQIPSCLLGGITLVISPLLALMRDQINQLKNRFQIAAASINSDQSEEENNLARTQALQGELQILFVSPEMVDHIDRFNFLLELPITLLVIDEAHCISTWGHDFRPSYRLILQFSQALEKEHPDLTILALTATADDRVEKDILKQLSSLKKPPKVLREKMDRPNIFLSVIQTEGLAAKLALTKELAASLEGHGLIYAATRENAELVADFLNAESLSTVAYHAGSSSEEKRQIQEDFSDNKLRLIAATTALGMGIDKKDLRFIIHFDIPGSITAYYQEVGRGGRDGEKAEGILLYDPQDRKVQDYFINSSLPAELDFQSILDAVKRADVPPNITTLKRQTGLHPTRVTIVIAELIEQGFLTKKSVKGVQVYECATASAPLDLRRYTTQHIAKKEELAKMLSYAEMKDFCRMATLRTALGDPQPPLCGRCDLCTQKQAFKYPSSLRAELWLSQRILPIQEAKRNNISAGFSHFDGKLRAPAFVRFMKNRAATDTVDPEILEALIKLTKTSPTSIVGIILLPSQTWLSRLAYGHALASTLQVPLYTDLLAWKELPEKRQGELLNNDQRHFNVHEKMKLGLLPPLPEGAHILFDDYIGSGATIKEAARALRRKIDHPLIPLTIAQVKWHLGKTGFV